MSELETNVVVTQLNPWLYWEKTKKQRSEGLA